MTATPHTLSFPALKDEACRAFGQEVSGAFATGRFAARLGGRARFTNGCVESLDDVVISRRYRLGDEGFKLALGS